jgi:hypothetical protein
MNEWSPEQEGLAVDLKALVATGARFPHVLRPALRLLIEDRHPSLSGSALAEAITVEIRTATGMMIDAAEADACRYLLELVPTAVVQGDRCQIQGASVDLRREYAMDRLGLVGSTETFRRMERGREGALMRALAGVLIALRDGAPTFEIVQAESSYEFVGKERRLRRLVWVGKIRSRTELLERISDWFEYTSDPRPGVVNPEAVLGCTINLDNCAEPSPHRSLRTFEVELVPSVPLGLEHTLVYQVLFATDQPGQDMVWWRSPEPAQDFSLVVTFDTEAMPTVCWHFENIDNEAFAPEPAPGTQIAPHDRTFSHVFHRIRPNSIFGLRWR